LRVHAFDGLDLLGTNDILGKVWEEAFGPTHESGDAEHSKEDAEGNPYTDVFEDSLRGRFKNELIPARHRKAIRAVESAVGSGNEPLEILDGRRWQFELIGHGKIGTSVPVQRAKMHCLLRRPTRDRCIAHFV
jgi:hypothetical protein